MDFEIFSVYLGSTFLMLICFVFAGRYEEDFVQERMRQLQAWVNRMVRHPVISRCDVFHHFLTCSDEKASLVSLQGESV